MQHCLTHIVLITVFWFNLANNIVSNIFGSSNTAWTTLVGFNAHAHMHAYTGTHVCCICKARHSQMGFGLRYQVTHIHTGRTYLCMCVWERVLVLCNVNFSCDKYEIISKKWEENITASKRDKTNNNNGGETTDAA